MEESSSQLGNVSRTKRSRSDYDIVNKQYSHSKFETLEDGGKEEQSHKKQCLVPIPIEEEEEELKIEIDRKTSRINSLPTSILYMILRIDPELHAEFASNLCMTGDRAITRLIYWSTTNLKIDIARHDLTSGVRAILYNSTKLVHLTITSSLPDRGRNVDMLVSSQMTNLVMRYLVSDVSSHLNELCLAEQLFCGDITSAGLLLSRMRCAKNLSRLIIPGKVFFPQLGEFINKQLLRFENLDALIIQGATSVDQPHKIPFLPTKLTTFENHLCHMSVHDFLSKETPHSLTSLSLGMLSMSSIYSNNSPWLDPFTNLCKLKLSKVDCCSLLRHLSQSKMPLTTFHCNKLNCSCDTQEIWMATPEQCSCNNSNLLQTVTDVNWSAMENIHSVKIPSQRFIYPANTQYLRHYISVGDQTNDRHEYELTHFRCISECSLSLVMLKLEVNFLRSWVSMSSIDLRHLFSLQTLDIIFDCPSPKCVLKSFTNYIPTPPRLPSGEDVGGIDKQLESAEDNSAKSTANTALLSCVGTQIFLNHSCMLNPNARHDYGVQSVVYEDCALVKHLDKLPPNIFHLKIQYQLQHLWYFNEWDLSFGNNNALLQSLKSLDISVIISPLACTRRHNINNISLPPSPPSHLASLPESEMQMDITIDAHPKCFPYLQSYNYSIHWPKNSGYSAQVSPQRTMRWRKIGDDGAVYLKKQQSHGGERFRCSKTYKSSAAILKEM